MNITSSELQELISIVHFLNKEVEEIKHKPLDVKFKSDSSPFTQADSLVNKYLTNFAKSTQFKNIISEENKNYGFNERSGWDYYWVIDPIDGTKEFIAKGNDYTINIALCRNRTPVFGLVAVPAQNHIYYSIKGKGVFKNEKKLQREKHTRNSMNVVVSKSHLNERTKNFLQNLNRCYEINLVQAGSSLKILYLAEGRADLYPRLGNTMEWDTCAAHAILKEAGGNLLDLKTNKELVYNKPNLLNNYFFAFNNLLDSNKILKIKGSLGLYR